MTTIYTKWLELEILHGYFPADKSSQFSIIPTVETVKALKNYNLLGPKKK